MKKKLSNKKNYEVIKAHLYGIFNIKTRKLLKISLDQENIDMELALAGDKNCMECQCDVMLII